MKELEMEKMDAKAILQESRCSLNNCTSALMLMSDILNNYAFDFERDQMGSNLFLIVEKIECVISELRELEEKKFL